MKKLLCDKIRLDESNHRYYLIDEPQIDFVSCTTFVEYFFRKFDSIGIANGLTANHPNYIGMEPQELVKIWEQSAKDGTEVHKEIDNFIKTGKSPKKDKSKIAVEWLKKIDRSKYDILSEVIIYSKEIKMAGTVDLLLINKKNKSIDIYDWKTTKSIKKNSYGMKMGRKPVTNKLMDCNFIHYSLQLSLYRYLIENYYHLKVNKLTLLHLNNTLTSYECDYMPNIIDEMLKYDRAILAKETEESLTKNINIVFDVEVEDFIEEQNLSDKFNIIIRIVK